MRGFRIPFDGHILVGDTGGDLKSSSLKSQTEQACAVIGAAGLTRPLSVLAASMGGYTAVTLTLRGDGDSDRVRNRQAAMES
jgi:alpha-beta hydrolase superfamily lysophospholipase